MDSKKLGIGDRMKQYYEQPFLYKLPMRMPVIVRLDGKNFHSYTRKMKRPFDDWLINAMMLTALYLYKEIQTTVLAYCQSDEISLLLHNYKKLESQALFANEVQKIVSITAATATAKMGSFVNPYGVTQLPMFDSRVFVVPETEVANYFIWRQIDATRNSVSMLANSLYSHNQLMGKSTKEKIEMCFEKGNNWNDLKTNYKRGFCIKHGEPDWEIPVFSQKREYIEELLRVEDA